jgi:hypothetical protein
VDSTANVQVSSAAGGFVDVHLTAGCRPLDDNVPASWSGCDRQGRKSLSRRCPQGKKCTGHFWLGMRIDRRRQGAPLHRSTGPASFDGPCIVRKALHRSTSPASHRSKGPASFDRHLQPQWSHVVDKRLRDGSGLLGGGDPSWLPSRASGRVGPPRWSIWISDTWTAIDRQMEDRGQKNGLPHGEEDLGQTVVDKPDQGEWRMT